MDELPTARHAAEVGHRVVDNDERDGEEEPEEAVQDVRRERVHLHHRDDRDRDRPGELAHLVLVVPRAEREDSEGEHEGVHGDGAKLDVREHQREDPRPDQRVSVRLEERVAVRVGKARPEPAPLARAEHRHLLEGAARVAHVDELAEDRDLYQQD